MQQIKRIAKFHFLRFKRLKGNPHSLALGTAIGVFIGLTPTMPLHTIIIIALSLVTRTSILAAVISSWLVCNPLTYFPIYYFSVAIGNAITPFQLNWPKIKSVLDVLLSDTATFSQSTNAIFNLGAEALVVLLVGGCILALPFTAISYYGALFFFTNIRKKRREKQVLT